MAMIAAAALLLVTTHNIHGSKVEPAQYRGLAPRHLTDPDAELSGDGFKVQILWWA